MSESRPLGEQESIFHQMHGFKALIPLQVLHIRGVVDTARLRLGLDWLQRRHPMLRAHVRYGALSFLMVPPFFVRRPHFETEGTTEIPLETATGSWRDVLGRELRQSLPRDKSPRMRVTLVRDTADAGLSHLIFFADHATIDAQSINLMCRQLMDFLAGSGEGDVPEPTERALPPPLEERLPPKPDGGRPYQSAIRLPLLPVPEGPALTRVVARRIDAGAAVALKDHGRAKGATLHGAITAAFLMALGEKFGLNDLTHLSTIDLRRMCRPALPAETFGCYVDILRTRIAVKPDFWATAREVSFRLVSTLAKDQKMASILKPPSFTRYRTELWKTLSHRRRLDGLAVTTAGESGLKQVYGNLTLEDVTMAVSLDFFGPTLMVIASERQGSLDLCINHAARVIATDDVTEIADRALRLLNDAAETVAEPA